MREKIFFLLINFLVQCSLHAQPYCTLPNGIKSTCLSYDRLPTNEISTYDFRFYFKTIVECGQSNTNELHDLIIISKSDHKAVIDQAWQLDSFNLITGLIDPCLGLPLAPCYSVYYYHADVNIGTLGYQPFGYIANSVNCCRVGNARNLFFTIPFMDLENEPPPGRSLPCGPYEYPNLWGKAPISNSIASFIDVPALNIMNSSPRFSDTDTILYICKDHSFSYSFKAFDPDGDSIAFHISQPRCFFNCQFACYDYSNFPQVEYANGFSVNEPAGPGVSFDQRSGLLKGKISDTGTYIITVSVPEYRNNKAIDSVTKDFFIRLYDCNELPKPKASIPDTLNSCSDFTIHFPNNSFPIHKEVNFNTTTFLWNFGDGDSSSDIYPSHSFADTGTYHTRLIVLPGLYCADTTYTTVLVYPFVNSDFTYADSCDDHLILFSNESRSTSGAIVSSQWKILEDSTILFSSNDFNISYTFQKAPQTYSVSLTVDNDKGCEATQIKYISVFQSPYPLSSHDTLLSRGATIQFQVNDGNSNSGGTYNWWPSTGLDNASVANPVLTSTTDTTYYVSIENKYGCLLTDSIHVKYYTGPDIYVPNAFTPNGDGRNDLFKPVYIGITRLKYFRVFNHYGQLVFETSDPLKGWNGNIYGEPSPQGAYVWEVSGLDYNGKWQTKKGTVILLK